MGVSTNTIKRSYNCKDVEVLTVSSEIVTFSQSILSEIVAKRPTWADPFFPNLKTRIDAAFSTYLGVDNAADLRAKTAILHSIMDPAQADLATFKLDFENDFRNNPTKIQEVETLTGYKMHWAAVNNDDQEALIELLFKFKTNMSPSLQAEIEGAGMEPGVISRILTYADTLRDANINQETAKSQRPIMSAAGVQEFNEIYDIIISVCKILRHKFKANPMIRENYSFSAVLRRLNHHPGGGNPTP